MLIATLTPRPHRPTPGGFDLMSMLPLVLMFVRALLPDDPPADEARQGAASR